MDQHLPPGDRGAAMSETDTHLRAFRLAHISDLHFGRTDHRLVEALLHDLEIQRPDLVAVSGDLTQRARILQFAEARAFLERLPAPAIVVPGNHDLAPLYKPLSRLLQPRERFRQYLGGDETPLFWGRNVLAIGLDSARHLRWVGGGLSQEQMSHLATVLPDYRAADFRVLVMHHPPRPPPHPKARLVDHLGALGVDLILTGHAHVTRARPGGMTHRVLLVQASTAVSTRVRAEGNGYNLILLRAAGDLTILRRGWLAGEFATTARRDFARSAAGRWEVV